MLSVINEPFMLSVNMPSVVAPSAVRSLIIENSENVLFHCERHLCGKKIHFLKPIDASAVYWFYAWEDNDCLNKHRSERHPSDLFL